MTHRTRNILFISLVILFLLAAPLAVFYSLGWRFDWKTKKIIQPGVFYFKVWPKSAEVYLDGRSKEKTDFFFGSVLIENLLAKEYEVEIKKEGFHSWKKTLEIKKREVTEAKNIVLVPKNPEFETMFKEIEEFFFSPDGKKIILKEVTNKDSENPGWALKLFEIDKNVKSHLIAEKDVSPVSPEGGKEKAQLINLEFSSDSKIILLTLGLKEKLGYYILETDKTPLALTSLGFLSPDTEKVYFNPINSQKIFILKTGELSEADLADKEVSSPILKNLVTIKISGNDIYYLNNSGFLYKNNLYFTQEELLNVISFPLKTETEYKIEIYGPYIILKESDIIYILDENKKSFEKVFEPVKNFQFSPDSQKLVYFSDHEIWILFLQKKYDQPQKEAGEQFFLTRFSEKIDNVFWYTNHYLIFNVGDKIKVAELDDRDKINIVELTEFKKPKIFWSNKKLYILSEENLYVSAELTP